MTDWCNWVGVDITLEVIGDPNQITNAKIFHAAFKGIEMLVDLFLQVTIKLCLCLNDHLLTNPYGQVGKRTGRKQRKLITPPDGNTVLHVFGSWLFDALKFRREGYFLG